MFEYIGNAQWTWCSIARERTGPKGFSEEHALMFKAGTVCYPGWAPIG
ncbi:hypothetical protein VCR31J2_1340010 [Vibrio coralliirubri]|uniref:Uncharacterized protein n=1 Tax=Vibrio coralliirubri TaxID=1516159 RepID=A0AA87C2E3_9VIBR|nr:hypothetical protein [Vibrio coralliirubri]CDT82261.1 hypothetical protein VCR31J2_1340010 [Vibrio coralliirubri]